jgi:hypothetical protein
MKIRSMCWWPSKSTFMFSNSIFILNFVHTSTLEDIQRAWTQRLAIAEASHERKIKCLALS